MVITGDLEPAQERALAAAAAGLPDNWRVIVSEAGVMGGLRLEIRIVGPTFVAVAGFNAGAHPIELAHFLELTKDERA